MQILRYLTVLAVMPAAYFLSANNPTAKTLVSGASKLDHREAAFAFRASEAKRFVKENGFNESVCFLVDMSIPSNKKRFYVYDLVKNKVTDEALVSHGVCDRGEPGEMFSNKAGSGCSSLGKYKIGQSYYGQWGYSYKLHGLEASNNKAYQRTVVLHAHNSVPDIEVEDEIVESLGCPMVSPTFLKELKSIINSSGKPVMLWIYR